jgi:SAM-dependent methyltransferase
VVLANGGAARDERVRYAYDTVARGYAADLLDELDGKPFDRWLLERLAGEAATGPVADAGCGPGHVAAHLALAGADVTGFDLSPAMVEEARRLFPELPFAVADLRALPPPDHGDGWSLIVAWYSLVHLAGSELPGAVAALAQSLRTGGTLAVAVHLGSSRRHLDQWFGESVDLDFTLHDADQVLAACRDAGLTDIEWYQRGPYAGHETDTTRLYVLGRRGNARASTEAPR